MSHKLSRLDEMQRENFKWGDGESERGENETVEQKTQQLRVLFAQTLAPPPPPSIVSGGYYC